MNDSFETLIQSIFSYLKKGVDIPRNLVEIKFKELLFNIAMDPKNKSLMQFLTSISKSDKMDLEYVIQKNFQYDLGMAELAKLSGRSLSAFKRDVKLQFNETPGNLLKRKRLERAKTLLTGSNLSINEICYESGFKNPSHFNKIFKEKYQLPPKQFRLEHKNH